MRSMSFSTICLIALIHINYGLKAFTPLSQFFLNSCEGLLFFPDEYSKLFTQFGFRFTETPIFW